MTKQHYSQLATPLAVRNSTRPSVSLDPLHLDLACLDPRAVQPNALSSKDVVHRHGKDPAHRPDSAQ